MARVKIFEEDCSRSIATDTVTDSDVLIHDLPMTWRAKRNKQVSRMGTLDQKLMAPWETALAGTRCSDSKRFCGKMRTTPASASRKCAGLWAES